jgi:hypothetical protein
MCVLCACSICWVYWGVEVFRRSACTKTFTQCWSCILIVYGVNVQPRFQWCYGVGCIVEVSARISVMWLIYGRCELLSLLRDKVMSLNLTRNRARVWSFIWSGRLLLKCHGRAGSPCFVGIWLTNFAVTKVTTRRINCGIRIEACEIRKILQFTSSSDVTIELQALGFCDRASWANCEVREKTNKMQQLDVYF